MLNFNALQGYFYTVLILIWIITKKIHIYHFRQCTCTYLYLNRYTGEHICSINLEAPHPKISIFLSSEFPIQSMYWWTGCTHSIFSCSWGIMQMSITHDFSSFVFPCLPYDDPIKDIFSLSLFHCAFMLLIWCRITDSYDE